MTQDDNLDTLKEGQIARVVRGQTEDWILDREDYIIEALVRDYDAGTLTDDRLRGSIGEIAGLRRFRRELEIKVRKGIAAAEKELGTNG